MCTVGQGFFSLGPVSKNRGKYYYTLLAKFWVITEYSSKQKLHCSVQANIPEGGKVQG